MNLSLLWLSDKIDKRDVVSNIIEIAILAINKNSWNITSFRDSRRIFALNFAP